MRNGTWGYLTDIKDVVKIEEPTNENSDNPTDWEIKMDSNYAKRELEAVEKQIADSVHILTPREINGSLQWGFQSDSQFLEVISVREVRNKGKGVVVQREIPPGTAIPFLGRLRVTENEEEMIIDEDYDMTASVRIPEGDMKELKLDHIDWKLPLRGNTVESRAYIHCGPETEEKWALPNAFIGARCNEPSADPFTIIIHILEQLPFNQALHSTPLFHEHRLGDQDKKRLSKSLQFHVQWLNSLNEYNYKELLRDNVPGWFKILPFLFRSTVEETDGSGTYKPVGLSKVSFLIKMFKNRERQHRVLYVLNLLLLAFEEVTFDKIIDENTLIAWHAVNGRNMWQFLHVNKDKQIYCQIFRYVKFGLIFNPKTLLLEHDHVAKGNSYVGWPKWDGGHLKEEKDLKRSNQLQNDSVVSDILRTFNYPNQEDPGIPQNKWVVLDKTSDGYYKIGYLAVWVVSFKTPQSSVRDIHTMRDKIRRIIHSEGIPSSSLSFNEYIQLKLNYKKRSPQHLHPTDVFIKELPSVMQVPPELTKLIIGKYLLATKVETRKIGLVRFVPKEGSASSSSSLRKKKRKRTDSKMFKKEISVVDNLESNLPPYGENTLDGSLLDGINMRNTAETSPIAPYYVLYGNGKVFSEKYTPNASVVSTTKWLRKKDKQDYSHCFRDKKNIPPLAYIITHKRLYPGDSVTFCYNYGGAHPRKLHNLKTKLKGTSLSESEKAAFCTTIENNFKNGKRQSFQKESQIDMFNTHYRPAYIPSTVCLLGVENLCETSAELFDRMWK